MKPRSPGGPVPGLAFQEQFPIDTWFKGCLWKKKSNFASHRPISGPAWKQFKGDFAGMFREPTSRVFSAWNHFSKTPDIAGYAKRARGGITKMIAGQEDGLPCLLTSSNKCHGDASQKGYKVPKTALAIQRLDGFKFIGLQEEYDLSVCLFHAMFGGECLPVEFGNMRPGTYTAPQNPFKDFTDPFDDVVYAEAKGRFWANMEKYNVTRATCQATHCAGAQTKQYFTILGSSTEAKGDVKGFDYDWPGRYVYDDAADDV